MPYIISLDKTILESINKKINDHMKANIRGYNATQWGKIIKHQSQNNWALEINIDSRNPLNRLSNNEKLQLVDNLPDGWIKQKKF